MPDDGVQPPPPAFPVSVVVVIALPWLLCLGAVALAVWRPWR